MNDLKNDNLQNIKNFNDYFVNNVSNFINYNCSEQNIILKNENTLLHYQCLHLELQKIDLVYENKILKRISDNSNNSNSTIISALAYGIGIAIVTGVLTFCALILFDKNDN